MKRIISAILLTFASGCSAGRSGPPDDLPPCAVDGGTCPGGWDTAVELERPDSVCLPGTQRCDGTALAVCADDGTVFDLIDADSPECAGEVQKAWPQKIGSCSDRRENPYDRSGYHRAEHIGTCVLPDKLPVVLQVVDAGSGTLGNMCQQAYQAAINTIFDSTGGQVYFVWSDGASPHPPDITIDCNDQTAPLGVTITIPGPVSIDPWNGARRLATGPTRILLNMQGLWDHYELYKQRTGGTAACINMSRGETVHATVLHELLHAIGFSHDNYDVAQNVLTIMNPGFGLPTRIAAPACNTGTEPGFRVAWPNSTDQRYIDPVIRNILTAYYANNSLLPE